MATERQQAHRGSEDARGALIEALRAQMDALTQSPSAPSETRTGARRTAIASGDGCGTDAAPSVGDSLRRTPRGGAPRTEGAVEVSDVDETADPAKKAFDRIVTLCSYQDYSREKMRQRLKREKVDEYAAEDALDRAVECGLIDDVRYGEALCAGRMRSGKGKDGIEDELWTNHIDPARIPGWPEDYEQRYGTDLERALRLIERHPPRSKRPRDSAYRRLRGKGYSGDIASKAAGIWWAHLQEESERS